MKHFINKTTLLLILTFIIVSTSYSQNSEYDKKLSTNLLQLPASTINLSYSTSNKSFYDLVFDVGYTFNYAKTFDFIGFFLSPHYKCENNGYIMEQQLGGYFKLAGKINFRKSADKKFYFFTAITLTNTILHEEAYFDWFEHEPYVLLKHTKYIFSPGISLGYNFNIYKNLSADFGIQLSRPIYNRDKLYGYSTYIPFNIFKY